MRSTSFVAALATALFAHASVDAASIYTNNFSTDVERAGLTSDATPAGSFQGTADLLVGQSGGSTVTDEVGSLGLSGVIGDGTLTIDFAAVRGRNDRDTQLRLEDSMGGALLIFGLERGRTGISASVDGGTTFVDSASFGLNNSSQGTFLRGIIDTATGDIQFFASTADGDFGNVDTAFDATGLLAVGSGNLGSIDLSTATAVAFRTDGGGTALDSVNIDFTAVPEPGAGLLAMMGLTFAGAAGMRRRLG